MLLHNHACTLPAGCGRTYRCPAAQEILDRNVMAQVRLVAAAEAAVSALPEDFSGADAADDLHARAAALGIDLDA